MLNIFFEKGDKITFLNDSVYYRASNNLDSQYYVLERIIKGGSEYIEKSYFNTSHPQLINYYTSWKQKELIEQIVPIKKTKDKKKGIKQTLLSKKLKNEKNQLKQHK